jgi:hypothetical protein
MCCGELRCGSCAPPKLADARLELLSDDDLDNWLEDHRLA